MPRRECNDRSGWGGTPLRPQLPGVLADVTVCVLVQDSNTQKQRWCCFDGGVGKAEGPEALREVLRRRMLKAWLSPAPGMLRMTLTAAGLSTATATARSRRPSLQAQSAESCSSQTGPWEHVSVGDISSGLVWQTLSMAESGQRSSHGNAFHDPVEQLQRCRRHKQRHLTGYMGH